MKKYIMNSLGAVREVDDKPLNAYELADELDWLSDEYLYVAESAAMLRMQADEITALRKQIDELLD
jgi:hypothetical protein